MKQKCTVSTNSAMDKSSPSEKNKYIFKDYKIILCTVGPCIVRPKYPKKGVHYAKPHYVKPHCTSIVFWYKWSKNAKDP